MTSATSEGAQGIFSKITFLKSVHSKEKDGAYLGFLVKNFTKSVHRGGVYKFEEFLRTSSAGHLTVGLIRGDCV